MCCRRHYFIGPRAASRRHRCRRRWGERLVLVNVDLPCSFLSCSFSSFFSSFNFFTVFNIFHFIHFFSFFIIISLPPSQTEEVSDKSQRMVLPLVLLTISGCYDYSLMWTMT